jgi:hypothetical protein
MQEGRKKAMEARKALREEEKKATKKEKELNKKTEKSQKEIQKVKNLELELQALQQQKDRIETLKKTQENRAKFRNKMKEFKEEEQNCEMTIKEPPLVAEPEPEPEPEPVINEEQVFKEKAKEMEGLAKTKETKELFKKVVGSFNNQISITDNIKNMVAELKDLIKKNTKHAKEVDNVVKQVVVQKPIEELNIVEMKAEEKYKSQLSSLMRLR